MQLNGGEEPMWRGQRPLIHSLIQQIFIKCLVYVRRYLLQSFGIQVKEKQSTIEQNICILDTDK